MVEKRVCFKSNLLLLRMVCYPDSLCVHRFVFMPRQTQFRRLKCFQTTVCTRIPDQSVLQVVVVVLSYNLIGRICTPKLCVVVLPPKHQKTLFC